MSRTGGAPATFTYRSYLNQEAPTATLYSQSTVKYNLTLLTTASVADGGFEGDVYLTLSGV